MCPCEPKKTIVQTGSIGTVMARVRCMYGKDLGATCEFGGAAAPHSYMPGVTVLLSHVVLLILTL